MRLQELRGTYGIKAPAPICADPDGRWSQVRLPIAQAPAGDAHLPDWSRRQQATARGS